MSTNSIEMIEYANKKQILIAFNDLKYRISEKELSFITTDDFIKICEKRFRLKFEKNLVSEVLYEIFKNYNKKEKKLADYETTFKCIINIIAKFTIFERNNCVDEYIKELNLNPDYIFDNKIVDDILKKIENDIIIEI